MRYDPHILDAIRARLPISHVIGRTLALKKQGREYAALSPFNQEKTPSFFVNDDKQFYHCFSSGKHGDIFQWLVDTQGLTFPEAVERLAEEAGVALPAPDPQQARRAQRARTLYEWMELAAQFFQDVLRSSAGQDARAYLARRGLPADAWETFEIGYAPAGRRALKDALIDRGAPQDALEDAGLVIKPEDGGASYDRFRDRVMFPIRDAQGKLVAFGGRALAPNARAKYLNSPDTVLFDKSRTLYRYRDARTALAKASNVQDDAAADAGRLIVAEGYMDVIALARAGFSGAVAPMGTALTEHQIELLWRAGAEPVLCFDGDAAGRRAALRAAERALPLLKPGRALRFALMPAGQDPDDLLRASGPGGGPKAMRAVLDAAQSMDTLLWEDALAAGPIDTPERKAGLRQKLLDVAGAIADEGVKTEFRRALLDRFYQQTRHRDAPRGRSADAAPRAETRARTRNLRDAAQDREAARLLRCLLLHPEILPDCAEWAAALEPPDNTLAGLRDVLVDTAFSSAMVDKTLLDEHLARSGLESTAAKLVADEAMAAAPIVTGSTADTAAAEWRDAFDAYTRRFVETEERAALIRRLKDVRAAGDREQMLKLLAQLSR